MLGRPREIYTFTALTILLVCITCLFIGANLIHLAHLAAETGETVTLIESKKNLMRRSIEQLGFVKDINSLVTLSGPWVECVHLEIGSHGFQSP